VEKVHKDKDVDMEDADDLVEDVTDSDLKADETLSTSTEAVAAVEENKVEEKTEVVEDKPAE